MSTPTWDRYLQFGGIPEHGTDLVLEVRSGKFGATGHSGSKETPLVDTVSGLLISSVVSLVRSLRIRLVVSTRMFLSKHRVW